MLTSPDRVSRLVRRGFRKRQRIHARYLAHHYLAILSAPSLNGKAREIHRSLQAKSLGDFPQLGAGGREETTQQPTIAEPLDPALPALRCNPAARRLRPAPPRSKPCLGGRADRCSRLIEHNSLARIPESYLHVSNPIHGDLRFDRTKLVHFIDQLRRCSRWRAVAIHWASDSRHWTHSLVAGIGRRDLSAVERAAPTGHTSSSDHAAAISGSSRTSMCK